jgi:hypothetical protein
MTWSGLSIPAKVVMSMGSAQTLALPHRIIGYTSP